ncbi:hypothetical protein HMPREF9130_1229 [Peptoniphilus sp. oral taxon 375 str. F0436]|nr:hypothetical protein HMPREF9130_1229 [Peptoniphilus sp. oral taxon 375 str. F0436]
MNKIAQIVAYIKENMDEIKDDKDEVSYGTLIGYVEALSIIKSTLDEDEWKQVGLDYDLDKKYLE